MGVSTNLLAHELGLDSFSPRDLRPLGKKMRLPALTGLVEGLGIDFGGELRDAWLDFPGRVASRFAGEGLHSGPSASLGKGIAAASRSELDEAARPSRNTPSKHSGRLITQKCS